MANNFNLDAFTANVIVTCNAFIVNATSIFVPNTLGGIVGGVNTSIQYNKSGVFGGSNSYLFDFINNIVYLGNSSVNVSINSTSFSGTSNNTLFVGTITAANVVSNAQLIANLANYQTLAGLAANVALLTSNNSINFAGQPQSYYANITNPTFSTLLNVGANVTINTSTLFIGNTTVNASVNSTGIYIGGLYSGGGGYYLGNQGPIGAANNVQNLIRVNANSITTNITLLTGQNGSMTGPITITGSNILTIQTGARLVIV